ncbi:hypothetical protein DSO57_1035680 [Entomophthora muscae]|uniref:Uncharacterized protein n=1 Tax=Entomophthora muscae TaxID=34485 RepID=A0ACC2TAI1_9FUNG|nr:hypothetical protein DSO57_1035680 [Entomophthora muscae]
MNYQPGPSPGQASSFIPPPPLILQPSAEVIPYDHSRYGIVILIILSIAEVVVPHLCSYCPLVANMLYLSSYLPLLYWALVLQYPDGWTPPMLPWYGPTPGHDTYVGFLSTSPQSVSWIVARDQLEGIGPKWAFVHSQKEDPLRNLLVYGLGGQGNNMNLPILRVLQQYLGILVLGLGLLHLSLGLLLLRPGQLLLKRGLWLLGIRLLHHA